MMRRKDGTAVREHSFLFIGPFLRPKWSWEVTARKLLYAIVITEECFAGEYGFEGGA